MESPTENKEEQKDRTITPEEYEKWMKTPIEWEAAYTTARSNVEGTLIAMLDEIKNPMGRDIEGIVKMYTQMLCHRMDELGNKAALSKKEKSRILPATSMPKPGLRILR